MTELSKCIMRGCRSIRTETRWVEVSEKKNKPPELLYEYKKICNECQRCNMTGYWSEYDMNEEQKQEFGYYEAKAQVGKEAEG